MRRQNLNLVCLPISPRPRGLQLKTKAPGFWPGALEYGVDDGNRTHDTRSHNPVLYQLSYAHHIALLLKLPDRQMAHPAGLEPATIRLEGGCSIQLSYGRLSIRQSRLKAFDSSLATRAWPLPSHPASGCS
ncbi:conserved hypothetical protein [Pseudomonas sp. 8Z]|nr:conserved hypothetical protein [Pseudomonas sp. 8Z]